MTAMALCVGEPCILREDGVDSNFIAKLVLRVMARDAAVKELVASRPAFVPKDQCLECALRVMSDQEPLMTVAAYQQSVEDSRRSRRRSRRRQRRDRGPVQTAASASFVGLRRLP